MSLYYNNFKYLGENSLDRGLIVVSFEPDNGFTDSFLSMTPIQEDYYDGTKKFDYGAKFDTTAVIDITVVKSDGTDLSLRDMRELSRWLTGCRINSWLDVGPRIDDFKYSFLGRVTNLQQYKLDGRTTGAKITFSSLTPWAYSSEQIFDRSIEQGLYIDDDGVLTANEISISEDGILCNSATPGPGACFRVDDDGVVFVQDIIVASIDNETDDLYSYIYLDIEFLNDTCGYLEIRNETLGETTRVDNLKSQDVIRIMNKQFIVAYTQNQATGELINQNRIFGDDFNFVWPRLTPGINRFVIEGDGQGAVKFAYRYPMKIGDCAMDISTYGSDVICDCYDSIPSYDTVRWQDIIGTPTSIAGYGITDAYTEDEVYNKNEIDDKLENIEISGGSGTGAATVDEDELNSMLEDILG